jgi:16S rRNA G1207 methylase RsmC
MRYHFILNQRCVYPGVFSHDELDAGTQLLMDGLAQLPTPRGVVDLGCGAGHVGLWALHLFPQAHAWLCDGDARAVRSARENAERLGYTARTQVAWWDAFEPFPWQFCASPSTTENAPDLVVINPPCHAGTATDYAVARQLFSVARQIAPQGRMLIVANRQLPYETELARLGTVTTMADNKRFKLLLVE